MPCATLVTGRGELHLTYPIFSSLYDERFDLEDRAVPTITFVRENKQVEVPEGDHIRYPALENDVKVYCGMWKYANCHGNGLCGTDRIAVSPKTNTNGLTPQEKFWLRKDLKKNPNMRLACQVQVFGDVSVDTQCEQ